MPITLSLQDGEAATRKMREILLRHPEVLTVVSQHGRPDDGSDASPFSNVELFAPLKSFDEWPRGLTKDKLTNQIQAEFNNELPGVVFNFSQYIEDNIEEGISGVKGVNSVKIVGPNLETITNLANQIRDQMSQVRGVADLGIFPVLGQPNLNIKVDRAKAARYGLNSGDVNLVVQAAMGGAVATFGPGRRPAVRPGRPLYAGIPRQHRKNPQHQSGLSNPQRRQCLYPFERTGDDHPGYGSSLDLSRGRAALHPSQIQRPRARPGRHGRGGAEAHRGQRETSAADTGWFGRASSAIFRKPSNVCDVIVPISFVLIGGMLYGLFNNLRDCLLALAGIPVAVVGGILALYISGLHFSISAAIGFVSLFGVSVMDGILMITFYNHEREKGFAPVESMYRAASTRMRPLLMTALSACIGLFPAAISTGIGSQVQRPLATVIVGGMLVGPVMLLLAVPALRMIFHRPRP